MNNDFYHFFIKIGKIFGIVPWYLGKTDRRYKIWSRAYYLFMATGICLLLILDKLEHFEEQIAAFTCCLMLFIMMTSSITKKKIWQKWMKLYKMTDQKYMNNLGQKLTIDWKTRLLLLLYTSMNFSLETFNHYAGHSEFRISKVIVIQILIFLHYFPIVWLHALTNRLRTFNKYSKRLYIEKEIDVVLVISTKEMNANAWKQLYKNLFDMSLCLNELFSWIIAIALLDTFLFTCSNMNRVISLLLDEKVKLSVIYPFISNLCAVVSSKKVTKILCQLLRHKKEIMQKIEKASS